uniref:Uncharacterized protein n=1 Tax=Panagrolaimus superbus TaxID=310955 RepID=A0A914YQ22_9BILA
MGIVFRNDVELGVHKASEHGNASRNVNIDFQFSGRNLGSRNLRNGAQNERDYPTPVRQERLSVIPSDAAPPSLPSRIVPSAQAQQRQLVPSNVINTQDFPTLTSAPSSSSTASLPNWRQEVQSLRRPPQQSSQVRLQISSGEQFPTLGGGGTSRTAPAAETFPSLGGKSKNNNSAANSVWGKGKPIQLFTPNNPPPPKPKAPETPRRQFIPLPDPGPQEPETIDPLFRVEAAKKEKRKAAKKKSKTVPVSAFANREQPEDFVQPSKFDALAEDDEPKSAKKNKVNKINYALTSDNTVKIVIYF